MYKKQAAWSIVFAQELLIVSAILLCVITFSLTMAVISLSLIQYEEGITVFTLPFWGVYFPIGLHGGWTLAGERASIACTTVLIDVVKEVIVEQVFNPRGYTLANIHIANVILATG